jgi:hypothetical protein
VVALDLGELGARTIRLAGVAVMWWLSELRSMVPPKVLAIAGRRGSHLLVSIRDRDIHLDRKDGQSCTELARIAVGAGEDSSETQLALGAALKRYHDHGDRNVVIRVSETHILRKQISLPLAAKGTLERVVYHDLDRQLPLQHDQIYFDCRILSRDKSRNLLDAELIAVKKALLDLALNVVASAGLRVTGVEVLTGAGALRLSNLLPRTLSIGRSTTSARSQAQAAQQFQKRVEGAIERERFNGLRAEGEGGGAFGGGHQSGHPVSA